MLEIDQCIQHLTNHLDVTALKSYNKKNYPTSKQVKYSQPKDALKLLDFLITKIESTTSSDLVMYCHWSGMIVSSISFERNIGEKGMFKLLLLFHDMR